MPSSSRTLFPALRTEHWLRTALHHAALLALLIGLTTAPPPAMAGPPTGASPASEASHPPALPLDPRLDEKARALFAGLRDGDPALAMPFFMPEDQFVEVKGIAHPGAYWATLVRWFEADVKRLQRELPGLRGGRFAGFTLGKEVRWTPVGKEWNRAPYHSIRNSTLRWSGPDGVAHETEVRVIIDFHGGYWITHLRWPKEGAG